MGSIGFQRAWQGNDESRESLIGDNGAGEREARDICNVLKDGQISLGRTKRVGACTEEKKQQHEGGMVIARNARSSVVTWPEACLPRVWECTATESNRVYVSVCMYVCVLEQ